MGRGEGMIVMSKRDLDGDRKAEALYTLGMTPTR